MSKCDLEILMEEPERVYHPGERVKGRVQVTVNDECDCKSLTLTRRWRTHGRGNTAKGEKEEFQLFSGIWMPGSSLIFPFDVEAPPGPVTYHGHHLNVDWYLKARADIPWAIDPKAETEFLLEAGDAGSEISLGPKFDPEKPAGGTDPAAAMKVFGVVGPIILFFGLCFLLSFILGLFGRTILGFPAAGFGLGIGGLVATLIGGTLSFIGLRNTLAQRSLGRVHTEVNPRELRPSQEIRCNIQFMPMKQVRVESVTAKLRGREVVVSGSGTNRTTHRHEFHKEEILLSGEREIMRGMPVVASGSVLLPETAPPTFEASDNALRWTLELRVSIPGWPDYKEEVHLTVRP